MPINNRHLEKEMATYLTQRRGSSVCSTSSSRTFLVVAAPLGPTCKYCRRWRPANSFNACERWEMRQRGASLARSPTDGHNFSLVDLNQPRSCPRAGQGRAGRAVALTRTGWLRFELRQRAARLHDRSLIDVSLGGGHAGVGAGAPRVDTSLSTVVANCHPSPPSSLPSQYKKNSERGFQEQFEERACDNDLI